MISIAKKCAVLLVAAVAAWGLTACGGGVECGSGTAESGGECVPTGEQLECGENTSPNDEGQCVLGESSCGSGTQLETDSGTCVPSSEACSSDGTMLQDGKCVAISSCGENTTEQDGECVADTDTLCGEGAVTYNSDSGQCEVADPACGEGTTLDPSSGKCVLGEACQSGQVWSADQGSCVDISEVCGDSTTFDMDNGLCVPDPTCDMGDTVDPETGQCLSDAENKAKNPDIQESENNDPAYMNGSANQISPKMPGEETVFTGTIEAPRDIDGDGTVDQDRDAFKFSASAGDWFQVAVQSLDAGSYIFKIEGPNSYVRWAPAASSSKGAVRMMVAPADGDYTVTILPLEVVVGPDGTGPIGSSEHNYVGTLEAMQTPSADQKDFSSDTSFSLSGSASDLSDNYYQLQNLDAQTIYRLVTKAAGEDVELVLQLWEDQTTLSTVVDPATTGASTTFEDVSSGTRYVLVDWKRSFGPSQDFEVEAAESGKKKNPQIADGSTDTTSITVEPFTTLTVSQTNGSSSDVEVEIVDPMGNTVTTETLGSGDSFDQLLRNPGTYEVNVTNNSGSSITVDLTLTKTPPRDLGTLTPGAKSSVDLGTVEGQAVFPFEFEIQQDDIGGIYFDADSVTDEFDGELFDSSANSISDVLSLDPISDTSLDEDGYALYRAASSTSTFYAVLENSNGSANDAVTVTGYARTPADLGSVSQGDSKSHTFGTKIPENLANFVKFENSSDIGVTAEGAPSGGTDSTIALLDSTASPTGTSATDTNPSFSEVFAASGVSFVQVHAGEGTLQSGYNLSLDFVAPPVKESEPNNQKSNATATSFGSKHIGSITQGNADFWEITLSSDLGSSEVLLIELAGDSNFDDWTCELLDDASPSNTVKSLTDKDEGCTLIVGGLSAGTYYLKVTMDDSSTVPYSFRVQRTAGFLESEANDSAPNANSASFSDLDSGTPFYGETAFSDDDFFTFTTSNALSSNQFLFAQLVNIGQEPTGLDLELQDSGNNTINTGSGETASVALKGASAQQYYLVVGGGSSFADNQYRIDVGTYVPDQTGSQSPGSTIPDDDQSGVTSSLSISSCGTVTDAAVEPDISHHEGGDLTIELTNPGGTTVTLQSGSVGFDPYEVGIYPYGKESDGSFDQFTGASGNGSWTLKVADVDGGGGDQDGTLNSWTLFLKCQ